MTPSQRETYGLGVIQERLSSHGIEVSDDALMADLDELRELELMDRREGKAGDGYSLAIPLMGAWIGRQHDFNVLVRRAQLETEDQNG